MSSEINKEGKMSGARMSKMRALAEQLLGLIGELEPADKEMEKREVVYVIDNNPAVMGSLYKVDEEQRLVLGIALQPDVEDSQGHVITASEIEKAAHEFMAKSRVVGVMHRKLAPAEVVESYTAPVDFALGDEQVSKGSWMFMIKVHDEELWDDVKKGTYTGFSIGGRGVLTPLEQASLINSNGP